MMPVSSLLIVLFLFFGSRIRSQPIVGVDIEAILHEQQHEPLEDANESNYYQSAESQYHPYYYHPNVIPGKNYNSHHSPFMRSPSSYPVYFPGATNAKDSYDIKPWINNGPEEIIPSEDDVMQRFYRCMNSCYATPEYNPVCGSDGETYSNRQKMRCAKRCGKRVKFIRQGACISIAPLPRVCGSNPNCN